MKNIEVLRFGAEWCGPCRLLSENLQKDPVDIPGVNIRFVDVDDESRLADVFNITTIPAVIMVEDNHKEIARVVGITTVDAFKRFIIDNLPDE